jgi:hypothetical protein
MEDDAIVFSDKSTSYVDISDLVELHVTEKSDAKNCLMSTGQEILP